MAVYKDTIDHQLVHIIRSALQIAFSSEAEYKIFCFCCRYIDRKVQNPDKN